MDKLELDWTGNKATTFAVLGASSHAKHNREVNDYYATDPDTINDLLRILPLCKKTSILEPACGEGHLSKELIKNGYNIISSDLVNRGYGQVQDFLKSTEININRNIITNPPYKYAREFIEKSLDTVQQGNNICMFLRLTFLEGQKRREFFDKFPPRVIAVYSKRQKCAINGDFDNTGSSAVCYAWFIWEKGFKGEPIIRWI